MTTTSTESKYAKKVRAGNRMYGPCRVGVYNQSSHEALMREIEDVKYWVGRIRAKRGPGADPAVTLEDIRCEKERGRAAA